MQGLDFGLAEECCWLRAPKARRKLSKTRHCLTMSCCNASKISFRFLELQSIFAVARCIEIAHSMNQFAFDFIMSRPNRFVRRIARFHDNNVVRFKRSTFYKVGIRLLQPLRVMKTHEVFLLISFPSKCNFGGENVCGSNLRCKRFRACLLC